MKIDELNERFAIAGIAAFETGQGGLIRLAVKTPLASARVYLLGAHVSEYQRTNEPPILWMSHASMFELGKPIRGGVPICFPWFGPRQGLAAPSADSPNHGFARLLEWAVESVTAQGNGIEAVFLLKSNDATRKPWPHDFELRQRVTVAATLSMSLEVRNTGASGFTFEEALHTYLAVGDVRRIKITGLEGVEYLSKVEGGRMKQAATPIAFASETDRVYFNTRAACVLDDAGIGRRVTVNKAGSDATVIWNPWIAKAKAMPDFGDEEWTGMVCIETANALENSVTLKPGQSHTMRAEIA